jgi:hypothetical protein
MTFARINEHARRSGTYFTAKKRRPLTGGYNTEIHDTLLQDCIVCRMDVEKQLRENENV